MRKDLFLGAGDHRRELIEVADEDHLNTAEPSLAVRSVETEKLLHTIKEVGPYHGNLIDDDGVEFAIDVVFGDPLNFMGCDARLESEEGMDGLAAYIEGGHAGGREDSHLLTGGAAEVVEQG